MNKMAASVKKKRLIDLLKNPKAIFIGVFSGSMLGMFEKDFSAKIGVIGDLFLAFLMMCTLPIVISAVVGSLGRMFHSEDYTREIKRMVTLFLLSMILASAIAYVSSIAVAPGNALPAQNKELIGKSIMNNYSAAESGNVNMQETRGFYSFWLDIIPANVFAAMSHGSILGVLFFSVFLGASIGFLRSETAKIIIDIMDEVFNAFQQIISWGMYALPLGLCCFVAVQISKVGASIVYSMTAFIIVVYIASLSVIFINGFLLSRAAGVSYFNTFKAIRESLLIAFCSRNSFASIPLALKGLQNNLKLDHDRTNLVVPFGMTLCNPGAIIYFVVATVFFAQIYDVSPVANYAWAVIIFGSVLASIGTAGVSIAVYGLLAVTFTPLGIPIQAAIPILLAVEHMINPILTVVDVHMNCTIAAMLSEQKDKK